MSNIHPYLESKRIQVDWEKCNPIHKGPRWIVVVVDNVAMGWSSLEDEPRIEGYFTKYVFDAWQVYRYCSTEKLFQLFFVENVVFFRDDVSEEDRGELEQEWCYQQDEDDPMVPVRDMESSSSAWVPVGALDDDGETEEEGAGYKRKVEEIMCAERENPTFC